MSKTMHPFMVVLICVALISVTSIAHAECVAVDVGFNIELCNDNGLTARVAGIKLFQAQKVTNHPNPYYRLDILETGVKDKNLRINTQFSRLRFEINSGGPYKDQLILEICGWDPFFIKWGQWGRNTCSAWIVLAPMPYPG